MNIIGVCGKGGSGKDTIANYLVDYHHYNRVAAADAMKVDLCNYLDMDLETWSITNRIFTFINRVLFWKLNYIHVHSITTKQYTIDTPYPPSPPQSFVCIITGWG